MKYQLFDTKKQKRKYSKTPKKSLQLFNLAVKLVFLLKTQVVEKSFFNFEKIHS